MLSYKICAIMRIYSCQLCDGNEIYDGFHLTPLC